MRILYNIIAIIAGILGALFAIGGFVSGYVPIGIMGLFIVFCGFMIHWTAKKRKPVDERSQLTMSPEQLEQIENDELPILLATPIMLQPGEIAHYSSPAALSITKRQAIGTSGGSAGISFRLAKGVYLRTGKSAGRTIYGDVQNVYRGEIVITNQRVIFLNTQKGYEVAIKQITAITPITGGFAIQSKSKNYEMILPCPEYPYAVICHVFTNI